MLKIAKDPTTIIPGRYSPGRARVSLKMYAAVAPANVMKLPPKPIIIRVRRRKESIITVVNKPEANFISPMPTVAKLAICEGNPAAPIKVVEYITGRKMEVLIGEVN